jgi:glycerol-3-phosphate dehydrogenase
VLTCSSTSSRNFSLGKALGEGMSAADALAGKSSVAEGAATAPVLADLAARAGLDMPIVTAVNRLLAGEAPAARSFPNCWPARCGPSRSSWLERFRARSCPRGRAR